LAAAALALTLGGAAAAEDDPRVVALVAKAEAACAEFDGAFRLEDGAVTSVPVADGVAVTVVDEGRFFCSTARSLWCGSGGCMVHLLGEGEALTRQAEGWRTVEWGPVTVILLGRDGGWCGGAGAQVCVEAVVWSGGRFLTLSDR
jgi:hypothetical protein